MVGILVLLFMAYNLEKVSPQCGGRLTDQQGSISAPDSDGNGFYDLDVKCVWEIVADENKLIMFNLTQMNIEEEASCGYDYLAIKDGHNDLGKACNGFPNPEFEPVTYLTESRVLWVKFYSDDVETRETGFTATYRQIYDPDCGYHLGQRAGSFGSHTVGHDGSTVECTWVLETPDKTTDPYYWGMNFMEHVAYLYILELDMELSGCPDTNLQVLEYERSNFWRYCDAETLPDAVFRSNMSDIELTSDGSQHIHFKAIYLVDLCGSILTNASGTFGVPIGDNKFQWLKQTDCMWIIAAPVGQTILLEITSLNVENESGCLQIYDGDYKPLNLLHECSGDYPKYILSRSNILTVWWFMTYEFDDMIGFQASYQHIYGNFTTPSRLTVKETTGALGFGSVPITTTPSFGPNLVEAGSSSRTPVPLQDVNTTAPSQGITTRPTATLFFLTFYINFSL